MGMSGSPTRSSHCSKPGILALSASPLFSHPTQWQAFRWSNSSSTSSASKSLSSLVAWMSCPSGSHLAFYRRQGHPAMVPCCMAREFADLAHGFGRHGGVRMAQNVGIAICAPRASSRPGRRQSKPFYGLVLQHQRPRCRESQSSTTAGSPTQPAHRRLRVLPATAKRMLRGPAAPVLVVSQRAVAVPVAPSKRRRAQAFPRINWFVQSQIPRKPDYHHHSLGNFHQACPAWGRCSMTVAAAAHALGSGNPAAAAMRPIAASVTAAPRAPSRHGRRENARLRWHWQWQLRIHNGRGT